MTHCAVCGRRAVWSAFVGAWVHFISDPDHRVIVREDTPR